jgi:proteasome accessory factor B
MQRTERLLDLVAYLLDAKEPISWQELREAFTEDYGRGAAAAAERKFERDKADLAEIGIPLTYLQGDDDEKAGYVLDRSAYYLPEIALTPEEMAVLYAAGSAALASGAFPGSVDLAYALRKVAFASKSDVAQLPRSLIAVSSAAPITDGRATLTGKLEQLWTAILARKKVHVRYRSMARNEVTSRDVDPWGLCLRRGAWVLVGYCHLRQAERAFHVNRIEELSMNEFRPKTPDYEVPQGFDIARYAAEQPWEHKIHEPVDVVIELAKEIAPTASRLFPGAQVSNRKNGTALAKVRATYLDGLIRRAVALGTGARVVEPKEAVQRTKQMLTQVAGGHAGAVAASSTPKAKVKSKGKAR